MGRLGYLLLLALATLAPSPAAADWQNTRWGMSEQQVRSAVKGAAAPSAERMKAGRIEGRGSPALQSPYVAGNFHFDAYFYFGGPVSGLSLVKLDLLDTSRCSDLVGSLRLRYGTPAQESRATVMQLWVWRTPIDQIGLVMIGSSSCSLSYQPRQTNQTKGL